MDDNFNKLLEQAQWQSHYLQKLYESFDSKLNEPVPGEQVRPGFTLEKIDKSVRELNSTIIKGNELIANRISGIQTRVNLIAGVVGCFYAYAIWNGFFA